MKVKSLSDLAGKGAVSDEEGSPLHLLKPETKKIAEELGVPEGKLLAVVNANSQALSLIVEALALKNEPPQVHVTLPATRKWTISFERDKDKLITRAHLEAGD